MNDNYIKISLLLSTLLTVLFHETHFSGLHSSTKGANQLENLRKQSRQKQKGASSGQEGDLHLAFEFFAHCASVSENTGGKQEFCGAVVCCFYYLNDPSPPAQLIQFTCKKKKKMHTQGPGISLLPTKNFKRILTFTLSGKTNRVWKTGNSKEF